MYISTHTHTTETGRRLSRTRRRRQCKPLFRWGRTALASVRPIAWRFLYLIPRS